MTFPVTIEGVRTGQGRRFIGTLALVMAMGTCALTAANALAEPTIKTNTAPGSVGVRGAGWASNESVVCEIFVGGRGWVFAGHLPTDEFGNFGGVFRVPNDLPPGTHVLRCRQIRGHAQQTVVKEAFTTEPGESVDDIIKAAEEAVQKAQGNGNNGVGQATGIGKDSHGHYVAWLSSGRQLSHAFLWKPAAPNGGTGHMFDLGTLGGASSQAFGVNALGDVVGISRTKAGISHPFLWTPSSAHGTSGKMVDLGTLGGSGANAYAVNDSGEVVGSSYLRGNADFHAFLYSAGKLFDLNRALPKHSGWTLNAANGIK